MVNMNAADDKECNNKQNTNKVNGTAEEACGTSNTPQNEENKTTKQNGNSVQKTDTNPFTNGAYPKTKQEPQNGSIGPSSSNRSCNDKSFGKSENSQVECRENNGDSALRNSECCDSTQKQCRARDRVSCDYDRNSSSEDEECCIYTYKGDSNQMADLPSSFFNLDLLPQRPLANSRNSSPDMDYLEMDFDPGPSNDRYSSTDSECGDRLENEEEFVPELPLLPKPPECEGAPEVRQVETSHSTPVSPLSSPSPRPESSSERSPVSVPVSSPPISPVRQPEDRTGAVKEETPPVYCYCGANKLSPTSIDENFNDGDGGTMVWKEHEAKDKQVNQIGVSLCGATAVVNALMGLNIQFSVCAVKQFVATRFRAESAPLSEYLLSRCYAGATAEDMIRALDGASQQMVFARFFSTYPKRNISLTSWLSHWIRRGAVPILTLNLQRVVVPDGPPADCWHHQMVYGVSPKGIHLTNPLEVQIESRLWPQLSSPSVLLVRREDVISRWNPDSNLLPLADPSRPDWRRLNVLGQVVNVIREEGARSHLRTHITIPASYTPGVTLCVLRSSPVYDELRLAPELPIDPFANR
ncbi:uncharacterized protein LOC128996469 [Macrosteles quadrilineatus]|uniref:uncharacterized protein LOC128996469 n=1 Tax=Macrosteles quadrilineatus TaxID=74068 RepID=UPI0023E2ACB0|nr:uncharacterized protein LOC128996469 [Macrosteles quadrilineatus]